MEARNKEISDRISAEAAAINARHKPIPDFRAQSLSSAQSSSSAQGSSRGNTEASLKGMLERGEISRETCEKRIVEINSEYLNRIADNAPEYRLDEATRMKLTYNVMRLIESYSPTSPERQALLSQYLNDTSRGE